MSSEHLLSKETPYTKEGEHFRAIARKLLPVSREAYEEDVRRHPTYHDGSPRPPWHRLDENAQWSWERNPTPRYYRNV